MRKIRTFAGFLRNNDGNVLMMTGLSLILLFAVGGSGVDFGRQQLVRMKIQQASDAAALAAATVPCPAEPCTLRVQTALRYYNLNYPEKFLGITRPEPTISAPKDGPVTVAAVTDVDTQFIGNLGLTKLESKGRTVVATEGQPGSGIYDIVMLLDNSNSMSGTKLPALKTAATALSNGVLSTNDASCSPTSLDGCSRVALIPYSHEIPVETDEITNYSECYCMCGSVSSGGGGGEGGGGGSGGTMTGWGARRDLPTCCPEGTTTPTAGCVIPCIVPPTSNSPGVPPGCVRHGVDQIPQCYFIDDPDLAGCKPPGTPRCPPCEYGEDMDPLPLTHDKTPVVEKLQAMFINGATDSSAAFDWSKKTGFLASARGEEEGVAKVVVWMTDGQNTAIGGMAGSLTDDEIYGAQSDAKTRLLCQQLKEQDTVIYTIGFQLGTSNPRARPLLRECASGTYPENDNVYYFDAPNEAALLEAFGSVLAGIKKIRIVE